MSDDDKDTGENYASDANDFRETRKVTRMQIQKNEIERAFAGHRESLLPTENARYRMSSDGKKSVHYFKVDGRIVNCEEPYGWRIHAMFSTVSVSAPLNVRFDMCINNVQFHRVGWLHRLHLAVRCPGGVSAGGGQPYTSHMETEMNVNSKRNVSTWYVLLVTSILLGLPTLSWACCPSDGQGAPKKSAIGLGEAYPPSVDLASDPQWQVYEFERDGVRYVQINDLNGKVRAATGRIAGTFWVMPIGSDADRVSLPDDALPTGQSRVLYRSHDVEVVLFEDESRPRWVIRTPLAY